MAGLSLQMGSFGTQYPGTAGTAATASPQGPVTASQAAFGVSMGGGGLDARTTGVLSVGTLAFIALAWLWWSLPR